uniref:Uncharacterized protein n=1 Tax=Anguilla anguilla TaxID=7936 RepID=A0A0E9UIJ5_ANGAN
MLNLFFCFMAHECICILYLISQFHFRLYSYSVHSMFWSEQSPVKLGLFCTL